MLELPYDVCHSRFIDWYSIYYKIPRVRCARFCIFDIIIFVIYFDPLAHIPEYFTDNGATLKEFPYASEGYFTRIENLDYYRRWVNQL